MNALKKLTTNGLLAGGLFGACALLSAPVLADNDYRRGGADNLRNVSSAQYDNRYTNARRSSPVTLRLNYDANGSGSIPLKRMLRNQHGIDTNNWRIRSVNVRHKSRRTAHARLNVGANSTRDVYLRRGITTIAAPRGRSDGQWVLGFRNAKVRDVAVVLEPRYGRDSNRGGKYRTQQRANETAYRGNGGRGQRALGFNAYSR